ncbi:hypothetical protein Salat_2009900 [Sesamum alatum]|uniref:Uncharacterized protein n=1 Tax=Sesamum alatum TaxID=300844 RepID=A0AAE1XZ33_9LAMI|nr:hypothetical protein Salat_2009900 [Sesamum alatum]
MIADNVLVVPYVLLTTHDKRTKHIDIKSVAQEAEVWTLCRIFKRKVSYNKCIPADWREIAAKRNPIINPAVDASSNTCSSIDSDHNIKTSYISFDASGRHAHETITNQQFLGHLSSASQAPISAASSFSGSICGDTNDVYLRHTDWEDLWSIVDFAASDPFIINTYSGERLYLHV